MLKTLIHTKGHANIQLESLSIIARGKVQDHPIKRRPEMRDKLEYLTAWVEQDGYLTADELCRHSGLTMENLKELNDLKLLTPDTPDGLYSSDLLRWARELAFQLSHGADLNKIVELLNLFWSEWPPLDPDWIEPCGMQK